MSTIEQPRTPLDLPGRGEDALAYIAAQLLYRHRVTETPDVETALASMKWNEDGTYSADSVLLFMLKSGLKLRDIGPFDDGRFITATSAEARLMIKEFYSLFNSKYWDDFANSWTNEIIAEEQEKTRSNFPIFQYYRETGQLTHELRLPTAVDIFSLLRRGWDVIVYIHHADNVEEIGATPFMIFDVDEAEDNFSTYYPPGATGSVSFGNFSTNVAGSMLLPHGIIGVSR